jgi:hypothetical protein
MTRRKRFYYSLATTAAIVAAGLAVLLSFVTRI